MEGCAGREWTRRVARHIAVLRMENLRRGCGRARCGAHEQEGHREDTAHALTASHEREWGEHEDIVAAADRRPELEVNAIAVRPLWTVVDRRHAPRVIGSGRRRTGRVSIGHG